MEGLRPPVVKVEAQQRDSSRWSVKKAIKILLCIPMRAACMVLMAPRCVLRTDAAIQNLPVLVCKYAAKATASGGQLQLKAQFQKSFGGCWKTGLLL